MAIAVIGARPTRSKWLDGWSGSARKSRLLMRKDLETEEAGAPKCSCTAIVSALQGAAAGLLKGRNLQCRVDDVDEGHM